MTKTFVFVALASVLSGARGAIIHLFYGFPTSSGWTSVLSALSIFALLIAIIHLILARIELGHVRDIAKSSSTKFCGKFPDNIETITQLVSNTRRRLLILADYAGYGHFSNHQAFHDYFDALLDAQTTKKIDVEMVVYGPGLCLESTRRQFYGSDGEPKCSFDGFKQTEMVKSYYERWAGISKPKTWDEFFAQISGNEEGFQRALLNRRTRLLLSEHAFPMFTWISDGQEAVFAFYSEEGDYQEIAFRTRDPYLISAFIKTFERERSAAGDLAHRQQTEPLNPSEVAKTSA